MTKNNTNKIFSKVKKLSSSVASNMYDAAKTSDVLAKVKDASKSVAANIADAAKSTVDVTSKTSESLATKVKETSQSVAANIADTTKNKVDITTKTISETTTKIKTNIEEKKQAEIDLREADRNKALENIDNPLLIEFINLLGKSNVDLSKQNISKIKSTFPIPVEQTIIWADAEFDLRPSGIALTDVGVFIKTNVAVFNNKKQKENSQLLYFKWESFNANWFTSEDIEENKALLVDKKCSIQFIETCKNIANKFLDDNEFISENLMDIDDDSLSIKEALLAASNLDSTSHAIFTEQTANITNPAGHGVMAEEANTMIDKLSGLDAKVVGRDNAKNGPDRLINNEIKIQTKYYQSARGTLESSFDHDSGVYRYMSDSNPMQLEVPSDQYDKVLEMFKKKISDGKVPGVSDPDKATEIVRKGKLTYKQAVNLTKAGTIESLSYDAMTGAVTCSCVFGITFVFTTFMSYMETKDMKEALSAGAISGVKVFGLSFANHMIASQLSRTSFAGTFNDSLSKPSAYIVEKIGKKATTTIVNGIRSLTGKSAIKGIAATKQLTKILRSNVLVSVISFTVFSVPETYNLVSKKISVSQYAKNISLLATSLATGAGGALAAGVAAAKVAAIAGTAVAPGVGTVVGITGGIVGGVVGSKVASTIGNVLVEDDIENTSRFFNALITCMVSEYLLTTYEIDKFVNKLNELNQKEISTLFINFRQSDNQELIMRDFLTPYFDEVVSERTKLPSFSEDEVVEGFVEMVI